jgi:hypothetical protein
VRIGQAWNRESASAIMPHGIRRNLMSRFNASPVDPLSAIQQSSLRVVRQLFTVPSAAPDPRAYAKVEDHLTVPQAVDAYTKGGALESGMPKWLPGMDSNHQLDRFLSFCNLLILQSRQSRKKPQKKVLVQKVYKIRRRPRTKSRPRFPRALKTRRQTWIYDFPF